MNIIFFGSHNYSLYALEALKKAGHQILGIVTQPDKPVGRHQILTPTPIKSFAISHKIPFITPKNKEELIENFSTQFTLSSSKGSKTKIDIGVVCVYGLIIQKEILDLPKFGCLNIHPSLLPKYRGTIPVPAAIIMGDIETGVTIIKMDEKMDHGPILAQEKETILETDTTEDLYNRLFKKGAELLTNVIKNNELRSMNYGKKQDDTKASYTKLLTRDDGFIDWKYIQAALYGKNIDEKIKINFISDSQKCPVLLSVNCCLLNDLIRGLSPWPGCWSIYKNKRLKLLKSHIENNRLVLDLVQFEGEKPITFSL